MLFSLECSTTQLAINWFCNWAEFKAQYEAFIFKRHSSDIFSLHFLGHFEQSFALTDRPTTTFPFAPTCSIPVNRAFLIMFFCGQQDSFVAFLARGTGSSTTIGDGITPESADQCDHGDNTSTERKHN